MFHLHIAQLVQVRLPLTVLSEVVGHSSGKKNVAGVATIHHPLREIDAGSGHVRPIVHITDFIDRAAINAHTHLQLRMLAQLATDFLRATHRCVYSSKKCQHHPVSGRQAHEFPGRLGCSKRHRPGNDIIQQMENFALFVT